MNFEILIHTHVYIYIYIYIYIYVLKFLNPTKTIDKNDLKEDFRNKHFLVSFIRYSQSSDI